MANNFNSLQIDYMVIEQNDRKIKRILAKPKRVWFHRLKEWFPSFVRRTQVTPSSIQPVDDDPDMVGSTVHIVTSVGQIFAFTINKAGCSAQLTPLFKEF